MSSSPNFFSFEIITKKSYQTFFNFLSGFTSKVNSLFFFSIGSPSHRIDCGYPGIDADQCAARKCCYDDTTQNVPFCYQSFLMSERMIKTGQRVALLPKECPARPSDRENCGYNRIKPDQCRSLGSRCSIFVDYKLI